MADKKTILIVDDDPLIVQTYQTEFELSNFNVLKAADGESAISITREKKPDVLLLDILMPMASGMDVLKALKSDEEMAGIPVFILSNIGHDEAIREALDNGAVDFILKYRYTPAEVVKKVSQALQV